MLTPEQRADPGTGQIPNPSPIAQEYYIDAIGLGQSTTGSIVGGIFPNKASLSWYKFTSDGVSPIIFDTYGTNMGFSLGGFGGRNGGELAVYDNQGHYIAGNQGSQTPASCDSNIPPIGGPGGNGVKTRQPINPTLAVNDNDPSTGFRNDQNLANLAFVKNPESNPLWDPANPSYTPQANWNQFAILPAGTYFLAVTGFSTYFSGFARDASTIDDPANATYTNGITSTTPFGFLTFHAMTGTYQLNSRLAGDFDQNGSIQPADLRLLRLQSAHFKPSLGIATAGFLNNDTTQIWIGLPNNPTDPSSDLQRYDLTGNARIDLYDVAAWGRYTGNSTSVSLTWNNSAAPSGADPLNPDGPGDGLTWSVLGGQNFAGPVGPDVFVNGDSVTFNDNNNGHYLVDVTENVSPAAVLVNSTGSYSITGAGAIGGSGGLIKSGNGTLTLGTTNTFTGDTIVSAGNLTLSGVVASTNVNVNGSSAHLVVTPSGILSPTSNLSITGGGASIAPAPGSGIRPRALDSITITGGGSLALEAATSTPQRTVFSLASLTITGSKFDLANNDLIITGTSATTIAAYITSAFNNGSWTGNGLTSSIAQADSTSLHKTAVAYASASSIGVTVFDGQNVVGSNVLVRFTYSGDANLDGTVNALDFNALASHFSAGAANPWSSGDFNYDGLVNSLDFTALATNFNLALPVASSSLGGLVPEPSLAVMLLLVGNFARRSRGRSKTPAQ